MIRRFAPLLSATIIAAAAPLVAGPSAERDARRASYFAGFTCNLFIQGQSGFIRYKEGGRGEIGHQEYSVYFTWKVENDRFCRKVENREEKCADLPAEETANERAAFERALRKNCH